MERSHTHTGLEIQEFGHVPCRGYRTGPVRDVELIVVFFETRELCEVPHRIRD